MWGSQCHKFLIHLQYWNFPLVQYLYHVSGISHEEACSRDRKSVIGLCGHYGFNTIEKYFLALLFQPPKHLLTASTPPRTLVYHSSGVALSLLSITVHVFLVFSAQGALPFILDIWALRQSHRVLWSPVPSTFHDSMIPFHVFYSYLYHS